MIDKPRQSGALDVSPSIRSLLVELRRRSGREAAAELDLEQVREVEAAVGMHLPDDLLAVFAAGIPRFEERFRMSVGMIIGHTGALRDCRARGDLVGVGQAARRAYYCLDKGAPSSSTARLLLYDVDDRTAEPFALEDWLREQLEAIGASASAGTGSDFRPCLTKAMPESSMSGRRVRHKKFGEGKALREIGDGPDRKVQVDFPGWGLKLMQARFLEFLD